MSDEIPVGSPQAPRGRHAAPGGWYPDPVDSARERYWDGWQWSRQTRETSGPTRTAGAGSSAGGSTGTGPSAAGSADAARADSGPGSLAGWWHRALAAAIDGLLLFVVGTTALSSLYQTINARVQPLFEVMVDELMRGAPITPLRPEELMSQQEQLIILMVTIAIAGIYHIGMLRWRGATIGKLITGLQVVPVGEGPRKSGLSWRAAVLRALMWIIPGLHSCLWPVRVVDVIMPIAHPKRQALHDLVAATQVVRVR